MTAASIAIGTGGAGISPGAGSGISFEPARGVQPSGNSTGDGAGQWQQSLQQAGVGQESSAQDSPISATGDTQASGDHAAQLSLAHAHALAHPISLLKFDAAMGLAQAATVSASSQTEEEEAAGASGGGRGTHAKANDKADMRLKDASASAAQSLLASLTMPAAVTQPSPPANAKASADLKADLLPSADLTTAHLHDDATGDASGKSASATRAETLATEKGIVAQGSTGIQPSDAGANLDKQGAQDVLLLDLGHNPSQTADASAQSGADAALAAGSQASAQASTENASDLSHPINASASAAASHAANAASANSNGKSPKSSAESSSAGHAHNDFGRDQTTSPAQGQGSGAGFSAAAQSAASGQTQPVFASGHAALNGQDAHGSSTSGPGSAQGANSSDPFSSIDSGSSIDTRSDSITGSASWIHAGTHAAEAGFQDSSLGWVGVRAQVAGGAIQASVVPSSSDAAQALAGHLAGLHAYLADHHALTGTVTMARPEASAGWSGAGHGAGHGAGQGAGQGQGSSQDGGAPMYGGSPGGHAGTSQQQAGNAALEGVRGVSSGAVAHAAAVSHAPHPIAFRGGGLISVVA